jgi:hypothetical protein
MVKKRRRRVESFLVLRAGISVGLSVKIMGRVGRIVREVEEQRDEKATRGRCILMFG